MTRAGSVLQTPVDELIPSNKPLTRGTPALGSGRVAGRLCWGRWRWRCGCAGRRRWAEECSVARRLWQAAEAEGGGGVGVAGGGSGRAGLVVSILLN